MFGQSGETQTKNGNAICYRNTEHIASPKIDPGSPVSGPYGAGSAICEQQIVHEFKAKTFSFKFEYGGKNGVRNLHRFLTNLHRRDNFLLYNPVQTDCLYD